VEEIIQPQLDNALRQKIASDLFYAWLKQQIEEVEVVTHLDSSSLSSNSQTPQIIQLPCLEDLRAYLWGF
jgi:adenine-specific DNA methylase